MTTATPEASSLAPGASALKFMMSETRESRWAVIRITRFGSPVPRWIATTSITSVGVGNLGPLKTCAGVTTSRQPPHCCDRSAKRCFTHWRAAPMPRVLEAVSDMVWRVPKPTSASIVARSSATSTAAATSAKSWSGSPDDACAGGNWTSAASNSAPNRRHTPAHRVPARAEAIRAPPGVWHSRRRIGVTPRNRAIESLLKLPMIDRRSLPLWSELRPEQHPTPGADLAATPIASLNGGDQVADDFMAK